MSKSHSRREFLKRAALLSATGAAVPLAFQLSLINESSIAEMPKDYKALVCIFLDGGNDQHNTLIPYDNDNYKSYQRNRQKLAIPQSQLILPPISLDDGREVVLASQLEGIQSLFKKGRLGIIANTGTLLEPTSKKKLMNGTIKLPPRLFSHNDQKNYWLSSVSGSPQTGWAGRAGDLFLNNNTLKPLTCISVNGEGLFLSGAEAKSFSVGVDGNPKLLWGSDYLFGEDYLDELRIMMSKSKENHLENEYVKVTTRGLDYADKLDTALKSRPPLKTNFPKENKLADALKMVAKQISAHKELGNKRQVFMVQLTGFDSHDNLRIKHPALLKLLNDGMVSFNLALEELNLENQVTTFTASEFGRTLTSNGDGSDHGWASHHFIMGGAVKGGKIHGRVPYPIVDGNDDFGQGRFIPDLSTDQFFWPLAKWFGVPHSDRFLVLPNLKRFNEEALNMMIKEKLTT